MFAALDALKAMEDEEARARQISTVLREQQPRLKELSELRRTYVLGQRAKKVPYRKIATAIGVSASTVQDIERGYSGSGRDRPRTGRGNKGDQQPEPPA
ncbi:helix-turn-helix domain-containing protein [Streptomyces niveus]|uniref:helix-turn-helix domain-containing protein n=1 Tax=Streptomyces niveus TaxID=193462 RepID=UPI0036D2E50C